MESSAIDPWAELVSLTLKVEKTTPERVFPASFVAATNTTHSVQSTTSNQTKAEKLQVDLHTLQQKPRVSIQSVLMPTCGKCDGLVNGVHVVALERRWHVGCLTCARCFGSLSDILYVVEGVCICSSCHSQLLTCAHCQQGIVGNHLTYHRKFYHSPCLAMSQNATCNGCGQSIQQKEQSTTTPQSMLFSAVDSNQSTAANLTPNPNNQKDSNEEEVMHVANNYWHSQCFNCNVCKEKIPQSQSTTTHVSENKLVCQKCFSSNFKRQVQEFEKNHPTTQGSIPHNLQNRLMSVARRASIWGDQYGRQAYTPSPQLVSNNITNSPIPNSMNAQQIYNRRASLPVQLSDFQIQQLQQKILGNQTQTQQTQQTQTQTKTQQQHTTDSQQAQGQQTPPTSIHVPKALRNSNNSITNSPTSANTNSTANTTSICQICNATIAEDTFLKIQSRTFCLTCGISCVLNTNATANTNTSANNNEQQQQHHHHHHHQQQQVQQTSKQ